MPRLDPQGRFVIPFEFRANLPKGPTYLAFCYDFDKKAIYLHNGCNCDDEAVICKRKMDPKGRIAFPIDCINIINASSEDFFIVFLQNNKIYIRKK